jgi:hypothetical protein
MVVEMTAAYAATVILVILIAFQLALALGAPWGKAAYGGVWEGTLPRGIRINSLVFGVLLYPLVVLYVLDAGGVAEFGFLRAEGIVLWVLACFFVAGTVMNAISRSRIERMMWTAPTATLAICTLVLALG